MQSTVTVLRFPRLLSINRLKQKIMRTLNSNQLSSTSAATRSYTWNSKRRLR